MKFNSKSPWRVVATGALSAAPIIGLAIQASPAGADEIRVDSSAPQVVDCQGSAGYNGQTDSNNNPIWEFANQTMNPTGFSRSGSCLDAAPGESGVQGTPTPPILSGDTDPIDNVGWAAVMVAFGVDFPVSPTFNTIVDLQGIGNLTCGNGSLAGSGYDYTWLNLLSFAGEMWDLSWSATFVNGTGTVTGTATPHTPFGINPNDPPRSVSGTIQILNNLPGGTCNDSPGGENVLLHLQLS